MKRCFWGLQAGAIYVTGKLVRRFFPVWGLALCLPFLSQNALSSTAWQPINQTTATWLWLDVYQATLYGQGELDRMNLLTEQTPLKLELCYLQAIDRQDFIKAASEGLPKRFSPELSTEVARLHAEYQDVSAGDCYTLSYQPDSGTQLALNGRTVFSTPVAGFKALYFGIWLGPKPLSDSVKQGLLEGL
ncbi:MAG: chalcone isomerase family protein [Thiomicrorhabdus chilensis]|uniref:chalcone isomerase family protein n=1 Tax=Thiomicrorhabdus chilensis TaxID=63656 RepID=UPI00299E6416|nr:chalcone isomerase family protein [Thiomicrorhabdus chilensis]MDX1347903.1 chalcone isomerase family protein [Thiomicrorhabdus chilensis]